MESFFSSLKTERTAAKMSRTRAQARADVFDHIKCFYNPRQRHSTLSFLSPAEFERQTELAQASVNQTGSSPVPPCTSSRKNSIVPKRAMLSC